MFCVHWVKQKTDSAGGKIDTRGEIAMTNRAFRDKHNLLTIKHINLELW